MAEGVLITGATGLLGSQIVKRMLLGEPRGRLVVLVRAHGGRTAGQRVDDLLLHTHGERDAKKARERVDVIEGDVSLPHFGLRQPRRRWLQLHVDHVIHCAATVRFDLPLGVARRHNTEGTRHVLQFCEELPHLRRLDYIGTAFVAGRREGVVREDELDVGQGFWNSYEQTKLEAEALVREFATRRPAAIYRPSVVVGDSRTGETTTFQGLYQLLSLYMRRLVLAIPANPAAHIDLVPMDYVLDALFALMASPRSLGRTFHLVSGPGKTSTFDELLRFTSDFTGVRPPPYVSVETYHRFVKPLFRLILWGKRRAATRKAEHYLPYLSCKLVFDKTNTDAHLAARGIEPRHPSTYFRKLIAFQARALGMRGLERASAIELDGDRARASPEDRGGLPPSADNGAVASAAGEGVEQ